MVLVRCKNGHEWDFKGKKSVGHCPKCDVFVNFSKAVVKAPAGANAPHPSTSGADKTEGNSPISESTESSSEGSAPTGAILSEQKAPPITETAITVKNVDVKVPEGLENAPAPITGTETVKKTAAGNVEIPFKTVETLINLPFNMWANYEKDPRFELNKTEQLNLTQLVKAELDQRAGAWFSNYSNEIALAIVLGLTIVARADIKWKKMQEKKKEQAAAPALPAASQPEPVKPEEPAFVENFKQSEKVRKPGVEK